jgi:Flp pilus assembly protein TadG
MRVRAGANGRRHATAAVEFALCLPLLLTLLLGVWEVGRIVEVNQTLWNSSREAARDASLGQSNLQTVANNLLTYLQSAEPTAFPSGHTTNMVAPSTVGITLPANTVGYTCWDATANRELFTVTFTDLTTSTVTDPTAMTRLDLYQINVQVPYASVGWTPVAQVTGTTRLSTTVTWAAMVDSPFQIVPDLPAE